jgi:integrase/recombinase XerD
MHETVKLFNQYQLAQDHSQNTIDSYLNDLSHFTNFLVEMYNYMPDLEDVNTEDIEKYLFYLNKIKNYKPSSRKRKLAVIRSFFRFCDKKKYRQLNPAIHVASVRLDHKERIYLSEAEVMTIAQQIKHELIRLVVLTMYYTGMRISESLNLLLEDVDLVKGVLKVRMSKNRKDRIIPINQHLKNLLHSYLEQERPSTKTSHLFCTYNSGRLTRNYVNKFISLAVDELGWNQEITAHTFRHAFASNLLKKGANVVQIQKLLGHTSLSTTSIYTHVNFEELAQVVETL